jgi:2-polyprenyl-3-methyl-5-hydroxy-6-metoxy-1,4-benzoquinol methylase
MPTIKYQTFEKIKVSRPVNRIHFISSYCSNKVVLDIGCFDETAIKAKANTKFWLHGEIAKSAKGLIGIDNSRLITREGIKVSGSHIFKSDALNIEPQFIDKENYDVIVAGEFIEHIESPISFLKKIKKDFSKKNQKRFLVVSTPNGNSFLNTFMGLFNREVQHQDHLSVFTYKILNTLCTQGKFKSWQIIPYRFTSSEMKLSSKGIKYFSIFLFEKFINLIEYLFPLLSTGYIVVIDL